ncbi:hypothetical protein GCM10027051_11260 [Niabella terrae]
MDIDEYIENVPEGVTVTIDDLKSAHHEVKYPITTEPAENAFNTIMIKSGAFPRDPIDQRVIHEAVTGTATYHGQFNNYAQSGIIDSPSDVGGWPVYNTYNTITDNDHDGMDDRWETKKGLNPSIPEDRNKVTISGYTALEVYLNSLMGEHIPFDF